MDIRGEKYGRLTVLKLDRTGKYFTKYWRVRCDCGTTKVVCQGDLRSGHTSSCGCLRRDQVAERRATMIGRQFGRLTVLRRAPSIVYSYVVVPRWRVRCTCGEVRIVKQANLRSGNTLSCGCLRRDQYADERAAMVGHKYGRLTVLKRTGRSADDRPLWLCLCDCGKRKVVNQDFLRSGSTRSCGCLHRIAGDNKITHGESSNYNGKEMTKEYRAWQSMKSRCLNLNAANYIYYGARGIVVCKRWLNSFENFLADVGRAPGSEFSIDRINNDGNYTPCNVRWATAYDQIHNRRAKH